MLGRGPGLSVAGRGGPGSTETWIFCFCFCMVVVGIAWIGRRLPIFVWGFRRQAARLGVVSVLVVKVASNEDSCLQAH